MASTEISSLAAHNKRDASVTAELFKDEVLESDVRYVGEGPGVARYEGRG
jgi:hypothetical protein